MKFLFCILLALAFAGTAHATTSDPRFDKVASMIAGHPVNVLCYTHDEGAWGYVWTADTTKVNIAQDPCEGLVALVNHDATVPAWKQALGALVFTHESFHLKLSVGASRLNEAMTECRAIRGFVGTVRTLGGSAETATMLQAYALAMHYQLGVRFPEYALKGCRVPWWWK